MQVKKMLNEMSIKPITKVVMRQKMPTDYRLKLIPLEDLSDCPPLDLSDCVGPPSQSSCAHT